MTDEKKLNKAYIELHTMYDDVYNTLYAKVEAICKGLSDKEMNRLIDLGEDQHFGIDNCLWAEAADKKK